MNKKSNGKTETQLINQLKDICHDISTPINSIIGLIEILEKKNLNKKQQNIICNINETSLYLKELVKKIYKNKDKTKIDAHIDLKTLIKNIKTIILPVSISKQNKFSIYIDKFVSRNKIKVPSSISQVLINLLNNGNKFTKKGHVVLYIHLFKINSNNFTLRFNLLDNGIGIHKKDQRKIFSKNIQIKNKFSTENDGSGLGLNICQNIATKLNIKIQIESSLGKGSRFYFDLKLKNNLKSLPSIPKINLLKIFPLNIISIQKKLNTYLLYSSKATIFINKTQKKVLIVDDNKTTQFITKTMIEKHGFKTLICSDPISALEVFKKTKPQLIFMDFKLPHMNGKEAAKEIRKIEKKANLSRTPIIGFTANKLTSKEKDMDDIIEKPISKSKMEEILNNWFN